MNQKAKVKVQANHLYKELRHMTGQYEPKSQGESSSHQVMKEEDTSKAP